MVRSELRSGGSEWLDVEHCAFRVEGVFNPAPIRLESIRAFLMKRAHRRRSGKGGLELAEEATHLLRTAPASCLASYYLGAIPFVLGALYFWADMSHSPFADQHLAEAALGMTLLFLWMKCCQCWFARRMRAEIGAE